ncbi:MAG TPA: DedA family protein [Terriglobales bacterium]|jgi:membrane protein DedA with SNARE-associated domain|nr:DedA family protein [Terriglobales bacterium]
MSNYLFDLLRGALTHYGYWAVGAALVLENAGLPVPGETILLLASFLAYSEHKLALPWIILVGVCAATLGDNLGFAIGFYGGRRLLERYQKTLHLRPGVIARGEQLFARYGAATIFVARFIAGMRIIAGPLAGVMRMSWRKFLLFNFLGALLWVTTIASVGYLFGKHWDALVDLVQDANLAVAVVVVLLAALFWWRRRKR